jgi:NDP-sugar pyrophosphorylase family protein
MKAVILAGGLGKRLDPFTTVMPKPLLPIGEKTILEIIIQRLKMFDCDEVIIATNYKSDLFERYFRAIPDLGVKITFSKEKTPLGTAGPIKLVSHLLTEPFIVMNGDIITTLDFKKMMNIHRKKKAKVTMATTVVQIPLHYGVVKSNDGFTVHSITEKPMMTAEVNGGIYIVEPEMIKEIPKGFFHMTDLVAKLLKKKHKVVKYRIDDYWLDIGQTHNYAKAQQDFAGLDFFSHRRKNGSKK